MASHIAPLSPKMSILSFGPPTPTELWKNLFFPKKKLSINCAYTMLTVMQFAWLLVVLTAFLTVLFV